LTAQGGGIGILPSRVAAATPHGKLKRVANMPVYSDELCLVYRAENRDIQAVKTVIGAIAGFW
jgi:DNA-binding transcriptional LysR family regulator